MAIRTIPHMPGTPETLGQGVRRLILKKSIDDGIKYTDTDIAREAGISASVMSRIVNDEPNYEPRITSVKKLAGVLGPEVLQVFLSMHRELVDMWQYQDTPAGEIALRQAYATWKRTIENPTNLQGGTGGIAIRA